MDKRVFNLIVLDASGSMCSIKPQALSGVNETIQTIKSSQDKHPELKQYVSFVYFNSQEIRTLYNCTSVDVVKELTENDYCPGCGTPLYDAIGQSVTDLRSKIGEDDLVVATIVTDGYENASREYTGKAIKALIDEQKAQGWVFNYIGANQDVEAVASTMGFNHRNSMSFESSAEGTEKVFSNVRFCYSCYMDDVAKVIADACDEEKDEQTMEVYFRRNVSELDFFRTK